MVDHVDKPANEVAAQPLLEIRNVTKSFDGVAAVDDVSLTINKGEIFALLGAVVNRPCCVCWPVLNGQRREALFWMARICPAFRRTSVRST